MKQNKNNQNFKQQNKQLEEFGAETNVLEVQQQNAKAEQKKQQASGQFAKQNQNQNNNR